MEEWRDVVGYEGCYQVSSLGRVQRNSTGRILKPKRNNGYCRVVLSEDGIAKDFYVHHLVWEAFVGCRPDNLVCYHKDGNLLNNALANLEFGHNRGNTNKYRVYNLRSKLNPSLVRQIRELYEIHGYSQRKLAKEFGVHSSTIRNVISGRTWRHVS